MPPKKALAATAAAAASKDETATKTAKPRVAASKKLPDSKAATKAAATKAKVTANISKKRKTSDNVDDKVSEELAAKKAKTPAPAPAKKVNGVATTNGKAVAPKKSAAAKKTPTPAPTKKSAAASKKTTSASPEGDDEESDVPVVSKSAVAQKRSRSASQQDVDDADDAPAAKKTKTTAVRKKTVAPKAPPKKTPVPKKPTTPKQKIPVPRKWPKIGAKINEAPTDLLDVYVFGEGTSGELGLGSKKTDNKKPIDVKRPRLNQNLSADKVGVVQMDCGGMHTVALTKDNKILTWGVNDQGALGRDTTWDGGLRDMEADDSDDEDDDDTGMNPIESTPGEVDTKNIAPDTKFVKVVASDSASFALTEDGRVYGWGTFRASDGILGFSKDVLVQKEPVLLDEPKNVTQIVAGSNHVMTLNKKGKVETWGAAEQNQLGRRVVQRDMVASALRPGGLSFKRGVKIAKIACGSYHSFAVDQNGQLYAWGLNNFGELGVENDAGEEGATVLEPTHVDTIQDFKIADISGGEHHSVACTGDGKLLTWGRIDGRQTGLSMDSFNEENAIFDDHKKPRILKQPTIVDGVPPISHVAAGTDNSFAITTDGKAYSWGFSANYQTGQGTSDEDIEIPTLIDNTAVRGKKLVFAGAGGQFSMLASVNEAAVEA